MKTKAEIDDARSKVCEALMQVKFGATAQRQVALVALLNGMSVALQWVAGVGGDSLQRLLDGEEIQL